jgi:hypothetical protein
MVLTEWVFILKYFNPRFFQNTKPDLESLIMMKRLAALITVTLACLATTSHGQISFTVAGTGVKSFDTAPTIADGWSTTFVGSGAGTYLTSNDLYTAVQTLAASAVNVQLPTSATVPPSTFGSNRWNSALQRLQSRPTGVAAILLMATLRNDSGGNVSKITITYDYSAMVAADSTVDESPELYGHKVFYSTTGAAGSWNVIPELSMPLTGTFTNTLSAVVNLAAPWNSGGTLYLLWADDNGPSSDAAPTRILKASGEARRRASMSCLKQKTRNRDSRRAISRIPFRSAAERNTRKTPDVRSANVM